MEGVLREHVGLFAFLLSSYHRADGALFSFVDRDMLMRFHWGMAVGHSYAFPKTAPTDDTDAQASTPASTTVTTRLSPDHQHDSPGEPMDVDEDDLSNFRGTDSDDSRYDRREDSDDNFSDRGLSSDDPSNDPATNDSEDSDSAFM